MKNSPTSDAKSDANQNGVIVAEGWNGTGWTSQPTPNPTKPAT
jgi:hypothetical protein